MLASRPILRQDETPGRSATVGAGTQPSRRAHVTASRRGRPGSRPRPPRAPARVRPGGLQAVGPSVEAARLAARQAGPGDAIAIRWATSASTRPHGRSRSAMPAMTASSRPRTPRSSEPHGRTTVMTSAIPQQLGGRCLGGGDGEHGVREAALARGHAPHDGTPRPSTRRSRRCRSPGTAARRRRVPGPPGHRRSRGRRPPDPLGRPPRSVSRRPRR